MNLHLLELTREKTPPGVLEQIRCPISSNKRFLVDHA
jgi:hypothetical protein